MSATGSDAGMTLIEALVVMALMALIATIAFPQMQRMLNVLQLRETTGALMANLRVVRSDSVRGDQDITFSLSPDGKSYSWSEGEVRQVPGPISLKSSSGQTIVFYGDGTTSGGTITASAGGREISVSVDEATGAVSTRR